MPRTTSQHPSGLGGPRHAEAAVAELRALGIADDHLGVAIHDPGDHVYEQDTEHETLEAVRRGLLVGVPIGALAGIGLIAVALPGVATIASVAHRPACRPARWPAGSSAAAA